ncbi:MAG: transposase [Calditrichia bacterium]
MGRPLRIEYPGAVYHITSRGNERQTIYRDKEDKERFLKIIGDTAKKFQLIVYAYVLMDNHFHLLLETPLGNLSQVMQKISVSYTNGFNARYRRSGHLFQGRYKAILAEKDSYLTELSRYIHLNPVRASMVRKAQDYPWSSYTSYLDAKKAAEWLETNWVLEQFSKPLIKARRAYKQFVMEGIKQSSPLKEAYLGLLLGSIPFIEMMKNRLKGMRSDEEIPALRRCQDELTLARIDQVVANFYGITPDLLLDKSNNGNWHQQVGVYFAKRLTHLRNKEIGNHFGGKHYSTVTKITMRMSEKAKKSKRVRQELEKIENMMLYVKT